MHKLDKVLKRCIECNLTVSWEKSHFMVREGIVLGHVVSKHRIEVDRAKLDVIVKLPPPTCVRELQSFLGHVGFHRRFIKDLSKIAKCLSNLLMMDVPFDFNDKCMQTFNILKEQLVSAPIVVAPNWSLPFELCAMLLILL